MSLILVTKETQRAEANARYCFKGKHVNGLSGLRIPTEAYLPDFIFPNFYALEHLAR
jgi:hypothetical protein